ncbi:MAG: hypothetical protein R3F34_14055 [Planctomycetota bacterium]
MLSHLLPATIVVAAIGATLGVADPGAAIGTSPELGSNETAETTAVADVLAVRAKFLHLGDGKVVEDGVLVVTDGVVTGAGKIDVPNGARVVEHAGHVSPGLVAARSYGYQPWQETNEDARAFVPEFRVAYGFDPEFPRLEDALAAGVTTVVLAPDERQVVGGRSAVVKTYGGRVLTPNAHLCISMNGQAANTQRFPTSYAGIVSSLDELFTSPKGVYAEAVSGNLGLYVRVGPRHEIDRALRFGKSHGVTGTLVGAQLAGQLADRIEAGRFSVVLPETGMAPNELEQESMKELADANVPFAFELRDANSFRASAAVARRCGASEAEALGSITSTAADIARVGTSVGRLARGFDGDFVLWSGDPLDLTSRVEAVYVNGKLAHGGDQ